MSTGAVRLIYAAAYTMAVGLGISIGTNLYTVMDPKVVDVIVDYDCTSVHNPFGPWWQQHVPDWVGEYLLSVTTRDTTNIYAS